jgi:eukaryotic-like serine/threonine-protein kinase
MNHGSPQDPRPTAVAHRVVGRFALYDAIASGGMATVHFGRMIGAVGFSKTVAIKRLHPHLATNPEFVRMLADEARLAARVQHPNVVATLDVVLAGEEVLIVLEYVHGESLWHLLTASVKRGLRVPPNVLSSILINTLHGLHAAHEACDEHGAALGLVHRDVSPQNILVGTDGIARVLDFGVAKATGRLQSTHDGQLKGKLAYMAPEQVQGRDVDRRTDVYAAAVVLWGGLVGRRLVEGQSEGEVIAKVVQGGFPAPSVFAAGLSRELDAVVTRGLAADPAQRFQSAREMAVALDAVCPPASAFDVAEWVKSVAAEALALRTARVREMESRSDVRVSQQPDGPPRVVQSGYDPTQSGVVAGTMTRTFDAPGPFPIAPPAKLPVHPIVQGQPPSPQPSGPMPQPSGPMRMPMPMQARPPSGPAPVAAPPRAPESAARLVVTAVVTILVTTILVVAGYYAYTTRAVARHAAPPPPTAPATTTPPVADPTIATAPAPPATSAPPAAVTPAPATATGAVAPRGNAKGRTGGGKPKPNCDSPFYVDSEGIKQIRPECM